MPTGSITLVLGAGASRAVSYASEVEIPSPLDSDFFDLLQRLEPLEKDESAVKAVLEWSMDPANVPLRRSMERMFYTLHLRAYVREKLFPALDGQPSAKDVVTSFALAVQSVLRKAHGTRTCSNHGRILRGLQGSDTIMSFNYDLVVDRALRPRAERRRVRFGPEIYGFAKDTGKVPLLLKLHGSSNWLIDGAGDFMLATRSWERFDEFPEYKRYKTEGTDFPIFLPFWEKQVEKGRWADLWRIAATRLLQTNTLIVWGYSLPETDVKSRELFRIALGSQQLNLCVIDPSSATRLRWREVLLNARFWEYESVGNFLTNPPPWWRKPLNK